MSLPPSPDVHRICGRCGHVAHQGALVEHLVGPPLPRDYQCPGGTAEFRTIDLADWADRQNWGRFVRETTSEYAVCPSCHGAARVRPDGTLTAHTRTRRPEDGRGRKPVDCEGSGIQVPETTDEDGEPETAHEADAAGGDPVPAEAGSGVRDAAGEPVSAGGEADSDALAAAGEPVPVEDEAGSGISDADSADDDQVSEVGEPEDDGFEDGAEVGDAGLATDQGTSSQDPDAEGELEVPWRDLVLDRALQMREETFDPETVARYAEALRAGATFPAVWAVRVDERLLVTDGWQRHEAHRLAGIANVRTRVRNGTLRDALLEAVAANADHGKPRTRADQRNAVRRLLMDQEWCGLSSRKLAKLARVSHTFVDAQRARYGVRAGQILSADQQAAVDGEPSPAWQALLSRAEEEHASYAVEAIRTSPSPAALAGRRRDKDGVLQEAWERRAAELRTEPWPWDEPADARPARCDRLDTRDDLERALRSADCPEDRVAGLYTLLDRTAEIASSVYGLDAIAEHVKGRPGFEAAIEERRDKLRAAETRRQEREAKNRVEYPWDAARAVEALTDPVEQAARVSSALPDTIEYIQPTRLLAEVRDGAFRSRVTVEGTCPWPPCRGWLHRRNQGLVCAVCGQRSDDTQRRIEAGLRSTSVLVSVPGFGFRTGGVVVDAGTLELLQYLQAEAAAGAFDDPRLPVELVRRVQTWALRPRPAALFEAGGRVEPEPAEGLLTLGDVAERHGVSVAEAAQAYPFTPVRPS